MADLRRSYASDAGDTRHYRRASDRAEQRASRAADHGDETALRIATAQVEALLRRRAEHAQGIRLGLQSNAAGSGDPATRT